MSSYIIPASITPRPIKPKLIMVEIVEAIMDAGPCAILPVAGDCLEGVDVVDGGWVAVDFTRRPAPPRYRSKGGDGSSDLCLCYATFPGAPGPAVMYKEYQGVWGPWQMVGTRYKSMWEGDKLRLNCGMVAKRMPDPESMAAVWDNLPELAPPLIAGVLRQGHKMLLAGPSKAGRSLCRPAGRTGHLFVGREGGPAGG